MTRRIGHVYAPPLETARQEVAALAAVGLPLAGAHTLDLGCGSGVYAAALAEAGASKVLGLDLEEENIALARVEANPALEFSQLDFRSLAQGPHFDLVFARGVLYYCEDLEAALGQVLGLLRPGGMLYATLTAPTHRARVINRIKRLATAVPSWLKPGLRDLAAVVAHGLSRLEGEASWTLTRQKTGTIFFPQRHLLAFPQAQALLTRVGFEDVRPGATLANSVLGSEYSLLARKPSVAQEKHHA